jgi:hypothetical protein
VPNLEKTEFKRRFCLTEGKLYSTAKLDVRPVGVLAPHSFLFLFFNLLYFLPVCALLLFNYSEGGTSKAADLDSAVLWRIAAVYSFGLLAFLLGSRVMQKRNVFSGAGGTELGSLRLFIPTRRFGIICFVAAAVLVFSKVLLIPLGVYSEYAFETDSMTGGIWSFSTFCSEALLFISIVVLFSTTKRNVIWFFVLTAINGINLLHGTRIFTMIACVAFCFFQYLRGKFTLRIGVALFLAALGLGYVIFLFRSNIELDNQTFSIARLVSPLMFEGVFSQLSLIGTIRHPEAWSVGGSAGAFVHDVVCFVIPRFLLPEKDSLLIVDKFNDLSPLGAFSGYAHGLIYFGLFFPFFYLALGCFGSWLCGRASVSRFYSMIYIYFSCDFLFRIMRDGYLIPIKMIINTLMILALMQVYIRVGRPLPVTAGSATQIRE